MRARGLTQIKYDYPGEIKESKAFHWAGTDFAD